MQRCSQNNSISRRCSYTGKMRLGQFVLAPESHSGRQFLRHYALRPDNWNFSRDVTVVSWSYYPDIRVYSILEKHAATLPRYRIVFIENRTDFIPAAHTYRDSPPHRAPHTHTRCWRSWRACAYVRTRRAGFARISMCVWRRAERRLKSGLRDEMAGF